MRHKKEASFPRLFLTFIILILSVFALAVSSYATYEETTPTPNTEETTTTDSEADDNSASSPTITQGINEIDGKIYFYNEDVTPFTDGYKEVADENNNVKYYYFQEDGTAFTGGYKAFTKDGKRVYYYFTEDGTAFTDGYLSFEVAGKQYYFFFEHPSEVENWVSIIKQTIAIMAFVLNLGIITSSFFTLSFI